ncbi:hypothetical protein RH915_04525 [Serpentinicella sp. ANB-PHB4]|uniref:hypothetical protein n=1 Tax=Serpentinicella sp. ANB-PHB4 TaxID=3074076 RepID=UPI00285C1DEA|nr:hypothetical protein [Serpentinicella sp. ANB-PHB4]MDR5658748.1 hypothetical protein [Serpentinicella sp. ANB-PHB4]
MVAALQGFDLVTMMPIKNKKEKDNIKNIRDAESFSRSLSIVSKNKLQKKDQISPMKAYENLRIKNYLSKNIVLEEDHDEKQNFDQIRQDIKSCRYGKSLYKSFTVQNHMTTMDVESILDGIDEGKIFNGLEKYKAINVHKNHAALNIASSKIAVGRYSSFSKQGMASFENKISLLAG